MNQLVIEQLNRRNVTLIKINNQIRNYDNRRIKARRRSEPNVALSYIIIDKTIKEIKSLNIEVNKQKAKSYGLSTT